jgi:hypothetical protein
VSLFGPGNPGSFDCAVVRFANDNFAQDDRGGKWLATCNTLYNFLMTHEADEQLERALALPENERAELAGTLISSLDASIDPDVDAAWQHEVT